MSKVPTATDRLIYDYLLSGNKISHLKAIELFKTTCLRDSVWRLGRAGYSIARETVYYKNGDGKKKCYVNYYIAAPVEDQRALKSA